MKGKTEKKKKTELPLYIQCVDLTHLSWGQTGFENSVCINNKHSCHNRDISYLCYENNKIKI